VGGDVSRPTGRAWASDELAEDRVTVVSAFIVYYWLPISGEIGFRRPGTG
jgi:hypothetical protein